jgi:hypothetical protein
MKNNEEGLELIAIANKSGKKYNFIKVVCEDCNKERLQRIDKYRDRKTNLCLVCNAKYLKPDNFRHGYSRSKLYHKYHNMIHRCYNTENKGFKYYGGRGIGVCMDWLDPENGLENFYKWSLENGFTEENNLQIDRVDNDGDYCPENCEYISKRENLEKMENLFGVQGRVVKKAKPKVKYENLIDKLKLVEKNVGQLSPDDYVPLWDFLENLGNKKATPSK